jgi:hypothetical protein
MNTTSAGRFVAVAIGGVMLIGCTREVATTTTPPPDEPVSHSYVIESDDLVVVTRFEDGSAKYSPTGWLWVAPPSRATPTATASGS